MTTPPASQRPTAGQAIVILLAAVVLAVTGCFGAFGVGSVSRNALQSFAMFAVVPVILFGLVGFVVGGIRLVRAFLARATPVDRAATTRPPLRQTAAIFTAGVVAFSGACMGLVDGGNGASTMSKTLFTLLFISGVAAAAAGFALMLWPRTAPAAPAPPPPAPPPPPVSPAPPPDVPPMEPRA